MPDHFRSKSNMNTLNNPLFILVNIFASFKFIKNKMGCKAYKQGTYSTEHLNKLLFSVTEN